MSETIKPQPGPQTQFLSTPVDICIYGGEVGGGKSYGLLMEGARYNRNGKANAVIFRRTTKQITQVGGLWDTSYDIYPKLGAKSNQTNLSWTWKSGYYLKMSHLEYEKNVYEWDGAQVAVVLMDELRSFTEKQFWYIITRTRSMSGINPYVRATTNPDPNGWLRPLVDWYIGDDGYAIPERSGKIRYLVRLEDKLHWGSDRDQLISDMTDIGYNYDDVKPKSFSFIHASLSDNPKLLAINPDYRASILSQHKIEKERLLGNWDSRGQAGDYFQKSMFEEIYQFEVPTVREIIRFWDRAATEKRDDNDPDGTCSVKMSRDENGMMYVEDFTGLFFERAGKVLQKIKNTASQDGIEVTVGANQDPAQAGKDQIERFIVELQGYKVFTFIETNKKEVRAGPVSAQADHGNIKIVKGNWNDDFYKYIEYFPAGRYKDPIDAFCGAFYFLVGNKHIDKLSSGKKEPGEVYENNITTLDSIKYW
jgi:predicted phage terminase large subunit-like protein